MNTATFSTMAHRPARVHCDDPFADMARRLRTFAYVVLVEPDGTTYKRISRCFDDMPESRDQMARIIRAVRRKATEEGWELRVGIERRTRGPQAPVASAAV